MTGNQETQETSETMETTGNGFQVSTVSSFLRVFLETIREKTNHERNLFNPDRDPAFRDRLNRRVLGRLEGLVIVRQPLRLKEYSHT